MAYDFYAKVGDRQPPLTRTLENADSSPIDLTGATVRIRLRQSGAAAAKFTANATIVSAALGQVKYAWAVGDLDRAGLFRAEWLVTFADGTPLTVPNDTSMTILVSGNEA